MKMAMERVWVIGAGFLGDALAAACRSAGARVLTIDAAGHASLCGSAAEQTVLQQALQRFHPEVVFCCTATHGGDAAAYRQAYLRPAEQLASLVKESRIVFCSSTSVYARLPELVVTEESPVLAENERSQILLQAEEVVMQSGGIVARLAPLYGPGRCELLRRYMNALPVLPGAPGRTMNYLHRDDAVSALLLLGGLPDPAHSLYNVSGEHFTKESIYTQLEAAFHIGLNACESSPSQRGVSDRLVDCTRLRHAGWSPRFRLLDSAHEWKE